jgi:hypothetical protein
MVFGLPSGEIQALLGDERRLTLYLNAVLLQITAELLGILIVDGIDAQSPRGLEIQSTVVDEHALLRRPLGNLECHAKNHLFGLARMHVTRTEENQKIAAQVKRLNAVLIEFQRFVINRSDEVFAGLRGLFQERSRLWEFLGLREHEGRELFPGKRAGSIK